MAHAAAGYRCGNIPIEGIGATDHVPFNQVGIPAFTVIKDFHNYDVRTRHANADLADAVRTEDLRQAAVFMAVMTWQAADAPGTKPSPA